MTLTKPYKSWGHRVLDEVRAGSQRYSEAEITDALRATGDITEYEGPRRVWRGVGTWEGETMAKRSSALPVEVRA